MKNVMKTNVNIQTAAVQWFVLSSLRHHSIHLKTIITTIHIDIAAMTINNCILLRLQIKQKLLLAHISCPGQLSLATPPWLGATNTSESRSVNRYTIDALAVMGKS